MSSETAGTINSVRRAFQLIEHLSEDSSGKRILQLAEESGLPPSTVHRVLRTLSGAGYVRQDRDGGRYRLTGKLLDVASRGVAGRTLRAEALPHLSQLRDATGESSHLTVLDGGEPLTVESVLSAERILIDTRVGERPLLYCTAVGKCLIAFVDRDKLEEVLSSLDLERLTEHTISTVSGLRDELANVRKLGYAVDWEENEIGVRCIGAPVRDVSGTVVASVGISGPAARIAHDKREHLARSVVAAAMDISLGIGYVDQ